METYSFPHFPRQAQRLHIALFRDVSNAEALLKRILALSSSADTVTLDERRALDFVFIDARSIASLRHVLTGVTQAIVALAQAEENAARKQAGEAVDAVRAAAAMKMRSVHAEVLYALTPSLTISESIKRFGLSPTTTSLLVLNIAAPAASNASDASTAAGDAPSDVLARMCKAVQGELVLEGPRVLDEWRREGVVAVDVATPDWQTVCSAYRIAPPNDGSSNEDSPLETAKRLDGIVTSMVAMKSVAGS